jgi:UDP-N-acetylglucosamine 2-epimerase (non-hydrolysing)
MDGAFFDDLELPQPKYNLALGDLGAYRIQLHTMEKRMLAILAKEKPSVVIVQGDTTTVLAGALAASKLKIPVAHHEAGLRSNDLTMMEEINRIVTDSVTDFMFVPSKIAARNVIEEGFPKNEIYQTGNTIVDAVEQNVVLARKKSKILQKFNLEAGAYAVATVHRAENVDRQDRLTGILGGLTRIHETTKLPLILPLHPRTKKRLKKFGLRLPKGVVSVPPLSYLDFLHLESSAKLIVTDSGGLQEEACILRIPCVTVRDNTERPETVAAGINILAGADPIKIQKAARTVLRRKHIWVKPYGNGNAGTQIVKILKLRLSSKR